jgi:hypothetical protein
VKQPLKLSIVATLVSLCSVGAALAQGIVPDKPYSEWTPDEVQSAASALQQNCQPRCLPYADGGQRGAFEAAACTYACFVSNLPDDYPNIDTFKNLAWQSYDQAKGMGSMMPEPGFSRP